MATQNTSSGVSTNGLVRLASKTSSAPASTSSVAPSTSPGLQFNDIVNAQAGKTADQIAQTAVDTTARLSAGVPTPNQKTSVYPVISADMAKKDLLGKQTDFNNIQSGVQNQQLANVQTKTNADVTAQNKSTIDNANKPSQTLDDIKSLVSGDTKDDTTKSLEEINKESQAAYDDYKSQVDQLRTGTFPLTPDQQAQVDYTQTQFDRLATAQKTANTNYENGLAQLGITSGRSRYAPEIQTGLVQQAVSDGITKISDIEAKAANTMADLRQGFQDSNYKIINDSYGALTNLLKQKSDTINQIATNVREQANLALQQHQFEYTKQQNTLKFITDNHINQPFFLVGNTAFNTETQQPVTFQDYLKLTGQDPNLTEDSPNVDWSKIQTDIQTPADRQLAQNASQFQQDFSEKQREFDKQYSLDYAKLQASSPVAITGAYQVGQNPAVDSWVQNVKSGSAKLSDVPDSFKTAVSLGLASQNNAPSSQVDMLNNSLQSLKDLQNKVTGDGQANSTGSNFTNTGFMDAVGGKGLSSLFGLKGSPIPGTAAYDFDAQLKKTVNEVVLPNLTLLHGLGRVTDREFQALQSAVTALSPNLSETEFKKELNDLTGKIQAKVDQANDAQSAIAGGNPDINTLKSQLQSGEMLVQDKNGQYGAIPSNEFDASKYTAVKGISQTASKAQPITDFQATNYTPLQKKNLSFGPSVPSTLAVNIGAGAAVKNNNPGNLRNVDGSWMNFKTPQEGFQALQGYLERAKSGDHTAYNGNQSLYDFFSHYAPAADSNNPKSYAETVAKQLGVSPTTKISQLNTFNWAKAIAMHESNTRIG